MRLAIRQRFPNQRVMWADSQRALVVRGYRAWWQESSGRRSPAGVLRLAWPWHLLAHLRVVRHGLRLGFHNLWPTPDGGLVGVAKKRLVRLEPGERHFRVTGRLRFGNKPCFRGFCVTPSGEVYYGEYCLNPGRSHPIGFYRSQDGGRTYEQRYEFPAGQVRHIHFVQWDPWEECIWMGTGDADRECWIFRSRDGGRTWDHIGGGSQLWRSLGVAFTRDSVYWGTDAGLDSGQTRNHIVRWRRSARQAVSVQEVQGPCHGNLGHADGTVIVSTGVERGANEKDRFAHLWASRDGGRWEEIGRWRKDPWPGVVQFGVVHFAPGGQGKPLFWFTCRGLQGGGETANAAALAD